MGVDSNCVGAAVVVHVCAGSAGWLIVKHVDHGCAAAPGFSQVCERFQPVVSPIHSFVTYYDTTSTPGGFAKPMVLTWRLLLTGGAHM